jgi:hypothetical protein
LHICVTRIKHSSASFDKSRLFAFANYAPEPASVPFFVALIDTGVALSVGVYPWPQQLLYDSENSRQVKIWRDWCFGKCKKFFDHFPTFFRYKEQNPDFVRNLFIGQDVHYNARGHQVLAEDLIEKYRVQEPNGEATR